MKKQTTQNVPLKIMALAMGIVILILLLLAGAAWLFWQYSGHLQDGMFQPVQTTALPLSPSPAPTIETEQTIVPDWIDQDGNAYIYRDDVVSVLLMGVDYMADETNWSDSMEFNGGNADMLALEILDTSDNTLSLLYIPRDTMADLLMLDPDGNYLDMVNTNISAAHSYGDGGTLSCELTVDAVSRLLHGIPIQRYAALDYSAIDAVNELLGGVEVTLDRDYTEVDKSFVAGSTVKLTNEQFHALITYRDNTQLDSAFDRGLRHMQILNAMFDQCQAQFKSNLSFPAQLYNSAKDYFSTNLTLSEVSFLAQQVFSADFTADDVIILQGDIQEGELYAEYHPDEQWLHDFVVATFCEPIE